jgi:hypothetical protein
LITQIILSMEYELYSPLLCGLLHSVVTLSLLGPDIFLSILFSNTHSPYSALSVRDQFAHLYKTAGKIIVLYILIFIFWIAS